MQAANSRCEPDRGDLKAARRTMGSVAEACPSRAHCAAPQARAAASRLGANQSVATCRAPHEAAAAVKQPRGRCEPAASLAAARPHAAAASPLSAAYLQVLVALASAGPQTRHRSSQLDARQQCRPRLAEMYHAARSIVKDATVKVAAVKDAAVKVVVVKIAAMSTAVAAERALRNWAAISAPAPAARATRSHLCEDARGALADGDHQTRGRGPPNMQFAISRNPGARRPSSQPLS